MGELPAPTCRSKSAKGSLEAHGGIPKGEIKRWIEANGLDVEAMAVHFRRSSRTIQRTLDRYEIEWRPSGFRRTVGTPADRERENLLASEGMPCNWIAEDLGCSKDRVKDRTQAIRDRVQSRKEWSAAWSAIRRREDLLALHREFAPSPGRI